ncbi:hypothetical protein F4055_04045 [Candidatus Poribacteria bacterium]|nr:hypothetical protein [Candidatus Poribacteria bacterium]
MTSYVLKIKLISPLTSAAGEGRVGVVDTEVAFDDLGLPIIPGRRLKGLWRDAYRDVVESWQQCGQDTTSVEQIFGDSGQGTHDGDACIHIANAELKNTTSLKEWLEYLQHDKVRKLHPDDVVQHYATVRSQTAIERLTGSAKENTLRLTRTLKSGLVFWARVNFNEITPDPALLNALALGAVSLKYMGTARTRGLGKVNCQFLELDPTGKVKSLTPQLNTNCLPPIKSTVLSKSVHKPVAKTTNTFKTNPQKPTHILHYRFKLITATVMPASDGDPNTVVSRQDIPGSHLWGIAAWCYLNEGSHTASDPVFRNAFLNGGLRFLTAYPEAIDNQQRLIPIPHSIRKSKIDDQPCNLADQTSPYEPTKRFDRHYAKFGSGGIETQSVKTERNYHHARATSDRRKGRALGAEVPDGGALFTYQAIQPKQTFQGAVLGSESDLTNLKTWVQSPKAVHIGRSRSAQYGEAEFEWIDDVPQELTHIVEWEGFTISQAPTNLKKRLIITTLSPLLAVNDGGHPIASFPVQELVNALGLPEATEPELISSFTRTETISGYHTHLRLPRQQWQAIAAGCVFEFKLEQDLTDEKLLELERNGLGLRKGEGFGRIAVNRQNNLHLGSKEKPLDDPGNTNFPKRPEAEIPPDLLEILKQLVRTYCVEEMQKYAREIADKLAAAHKIPRNALLGRLRLFLRHEKPVESLEKLRKPAMEQLTNYQINMIECPFFDLPNQQTLFDIFKNAWSQPELFTKGLVKSKVDDLATDFDETIHIGMIQTLLDNDSTKLCDDFLNYLITTLRISRQRRSK